MSRRSPRHHADSVPASFNMSKEFQYFEYNNCQVRFAALLRDSRVADKYRSEDGRFYIQYFSHNGGFIELQDSFFTIYWPSNLWPYMKPELDKLPKEIVDIAAIRSMFSR